MPEIALSLLKIPSGGRAGEKPASSDCVQSGNRVTVAPVIAACGGPG
jgi:hypothetical protein